MSSIDDLQTPPSPTDFDRGPPAKTFAEKLAAAAPNTYIEATAKEIGDYIVMRKAAIPVAPPKLKTAADILQHAESLVSGDRQKTHGDKKTNHDNIAKLWSAYLGFEITAEQVSLMMVLLKIARTKTGSFNPDDFVDLVGYGSIAGELAQIED